MAQSAIVHVHRARPGNLSGIELQPVAVKEMRVHQRRKQIVRGSNGMKIAIEMKIDFGAGLDL